MEPDVKWEREVVDIKQNGLALQSTAYGAYGG